MRSESHGTPFFLETDKPAPAVTIPRTFATSRHKFKITYYYEKRYRYVAQYVHIRIIL